MEPLKFLEQNGALVTELQARSRSTNSSEAAGPTLLPTARFVTVPATPGSDVEELYVSVTLVEN